MREKNDSYVVFARKWRPRTFEEVVGQDAVKLQLQNALADARIANAYLFAGPRGVGKTSVARILAKALNCEKGITPHPCNKCAQCVSIASGNSMDVMEIDGASYTGIDNIRDLQEGINRASFSARKKVYIIDEVHMLSIPAFNSLLKTLEEPPLFVVFIFATTSFEKIPETIKSRCQIYHFERISTKDIIDRLDLILSKEKGIEVSTKEKDAILNAIATSAEGGMRDAEVALEQLISLSGGKLKFEYVSQLLGLVEYDLLIETVRDLAKRDVRALLTRVAQLVNKGRDLERFVKTFQGFIRDLLILKSGGNPSLANFTEERLNEIQKLLKNLSLPFLLNIMNNFLLLEERMKGSAQVRFLLEFTFIKLSVIQSDVDIETVLKRIEGIERTRIPTGQVPARKDVSPLTPKPEAVTADLFGGKANPLEMDIQPLAPDIIGDHTRLWEQFKKAAGERKHIIEDVLSRSSLHKFDDHTLFINVSGEFDKKMLTSPDSIQLMEKTLSRLLGRPARVKVQVSKKEPSETAPLIQPIPVASEPDEETEFPSAVGETALSAEDSPIVNEEPVPAEGQIPSDINPEQYRHLFRETTVSKKMVLDLLQKNPDAKDAVERIKALFNTSLTHFDGKSIK